MTTGVDESLLELIWRWERRGLDVIFFPLPHDPGRTGPRPGNLQAQSESSARVGAQAFYHLVSILSALSNEIWPALEENWIMGPSINTIFPPLKLHTWWKVVRCHVLKLLPNSFALIYCAWCPWLLKTVVALSILTAARLTTFFTLPKRQNYFQSPLDLIWPPQRYPRRQGGEVGTIGFECFVTMVDNSTSWWIVCSWVIWRCL